MNNTYLIAPSRHQILHLTAWAYDRVKLMDPETPWPTGRYLPLCQQDMGRETWRITGPWAERWPTHRKYAICRRCHKNLAAVFDELLRVQAML